MKGKYRTHKEYLDKILEDPEAKAIYFEELYDLAKGDKDRLAEELAEYKIALLHCINDSDESLAGDAIELQEREEYYLKRAMEELKGRK